MRLFGWCRGCCKIKRGTVEPETAMHPVPVVLCDECREAGKR